MEKKPSGSQQVDQVRSNNRLLSQIWLRARRRLRLDFSVVSMIHLPDVTDQPADPAEVNRGQRVSSDGVDSPTS